MVDNKGWVQHRRLKYLTEHQKTFRFRLIESKRFGLLWNLGFFRKQPVFFSTWRTAHGLIKKRPGIFSDSDFNYFMTAVTSHSNIGGGLDPMNPIPGRTPEEAFDLAVGLLRKFRVVTANSMILHEMLSNVLPDLIYCPNGVDIDFFRPAGNRKYDPDMIRIGWAGKVRGPKNFPVIERACNELEAMGGFKAEFVKVPKHFSKAPFSPEQMRDFYRSIDFYLCASWNEGTPNPGLEAGSCGVPVVSTRVGNMRELIKPGVNGFFIEPSSGSIVETFKDIRSMDKEEYDRMSAAMRASIIHDWSWEKRINNFVSSFERFTDNTRKDI